MVRRNSRFLESLLGLVVTCFFALMLPFGLEGTASAQLSAPAADLQIFHPAVDSKGYVTVNSSQILGHLDPSFGLVTSWGRQVLTFEQGTNRFTVNNIMTPHLQVALGLWNWLELGVGIPFTIINGNGEPAFGGAGNPNNAFDYGFAEQGIGDLTIHPKIRLLNNHSHAVGLGILATVSLPTGDTRKLLGEDQVVFSPTALVDKEFGERGRFRMAMNVGARIRPNDRVIVDTGAFPPPPNAMVPVRMGTGQRVALGNELLYGAGLSYAILPQRFDVLTEVYGSAGFNGDRNRPAEWLAAIKLYMARNSFFQLGGGIGLTGTKEYGAASGGRFFIGFIFEPSIGDRDGDGIKDDVDQCPDDPEDPDGFEDADGCPDPDNDKDGILDVDDACPNDPETKNGFEDEDGCPDRLELDRDGDGILDNVDKCPDEPEDRDGFEDEDGCPDPDNDRDGILDVDDLCPNDPEDMDGFEDKDGCPDLDNDKDRIADKDDKCPNEPETYNGTDDEDGCPDKGRVIVHKGKIEILDKIYFETDKDIIKPISFPILNAIAATLKGNPQILQVEIQGHADERGSADHNLDLTERRSQSVRRYLAEQGVEEHRLEAHGYGETQPICAQHNEGCWSKNRRVEFVIRKRADQPLE